MGWHRHQVRNWLCSVVTDAKICTYGRAWGYSKPQATWRYGMPTSRWYDRCSNESRLHWLIAIQSISAFMVSFTTWQAHNLPSWFSHIVLVKDGLRHLTWRWWSPVKAPFLFLIGAAAGKLLLVWSASKIALNKRKEFNLSSHASGLIEISFRWNYMNRWNVQ